MAEQSESTPAQRGRPATIGAAAIVAAACDIADEKGLPAVSMRAVAGRLGVAAMSLYRHIPDKEQLLAAMVEQVAGEYDLTTLTPAHWRDDLVALARQQRDIIARHPWLPELASRFHPLGPASLAYVERVLGLFHAGGAPRQSQLETVGLFNGFVTALAAASLRPPPTAPHQDVMDLLATGQYPHVAAVAGRTLPPHLDLDREFDRLVARIVDGLL